jgi:hypothetical protein
MRSSISRAIFATLAIISACGFLHAQNQTANKSEKPAGSVSGRVTIKGKGARGIAVTIRRSENSNPFETFPRAVSDEDGNYKISGVGAGSYEVTPGNTAYIVASNNNIRSRVVNLGDGENVENVNFALVRGGVITGKITDADGRPVIEQQVRLVRADSPDPKNPQPARTSFPISTMVTDDRGVYRIFGLNPGKYKVATGRSDDGLSFSFGGRSSYKEVYYGDVADVTKATVIEVGEGSEATNIDIGLGRPYQTFAASGKVVDEKGMPVQGARFGLQRLIGDRPDFMNAFIVSQSNGDFVVEGLIPGKYSVFMMQDANAEQKADTTTFDIIDSDISGVTIRLSKGALISGRVVLETEDKQAFARLAQLQVAAWVPGVNSSVRSTIGTDGSFRLGGLSTGKASLQLMPYMDMSQLKGFMVSRIERDGVVQSEGLEIKEGEEVTGVRIIVSYGNATLRGVVNIENGPLPPEARLNVRLTKPGENLSNLRPPRVDERGRFTVDGLPTGTYDIWVSVMGLQKPRHVKQSVTLQDGITTDVAITLDLAPKP